MSELAQAMRSIDQRKYPERCELLTAEYARRRELPEGTVLVPSPPQKPIMVVITTILGLIAIPVVLAALIFWLGYGFAPIWLEAELGSGNLQLRLRLN